MELQYGSVKAPYIYMTHCYQVGYIKSNFYIPNNYNNFFPCKHNIFEYSISV